MTAGAQALWQQKKKKPKNQPSNSWYKVFGLMCLVLPNLALCIMAKHLHFGFK